ncbi:response regulator [Paenibacillus puerhi]|uniref:response regulator n=1 Tax=Paenibacillus puerhi TaxID=2692622 RepID=UPI00135706B2|nr:response regulator [Paenibacillus puerhi]
MRLMIADDEDNIRMGLEKMLSRMELNIEVIGSHANGMEALSHLHKLDFSDLEVLITDIKMPVMDGLRLTELVREKSRDIAVIVLSGFSEFDYARTAIRYGVSDYLLKPVDKSQLYETLKRIAKLNRSVEREMEDPKDYGEVEQIKGILRQEYGKPFELERLAERIGKSSSHISRLFKNKTNETLTDYLIRIRIDKAKQFIADHPSLKNYEIAELVGYSDPVYFNKLFKKVTGMTPKDYRGKRS